VCVCDDERVCGSFDDCVCVMMRECVCGFFDDLCVMKCVDLLMIVCVCH